MTRTPKPAFPKSNIRGILTLAMILVLVAPALALPVPEVPEVPIASSQSGPTEVAGCVLEERFEDKPWGTKPWGWNFLNGAHYIGHGGFHYSPYHAAGFKAAGVLRTPSVYLTPTDATVQFRSYHDDSMYPQSDLRGVRLILSGDPSWAYNVGVVQGTRGQWLEPVFDMSGVVGALGAQWFQLEFYFVPSNGGTSNFHNWLIDDVRVGHCPDLTPPDGDAWGTSLPSIRSPSHPDPNKFYANRMADLSYFAFDFESGVAGYSLGIDDYTYSYGVDCTIDKNKDDQSTKYLLPAFGIVDFTMRAIDEAGNCSENAYVTRVSVDAMAPTIGFRTPFHQQKINDAYATIHATYEDVDEGRDPFETLTRIHVPSIRLTVDGIQVYPQEISANELSYTPPTDKPWTHGWHDVELALRDTAVGSQEIIDQWRFYYEAVSCSPELPTDCGTGELLEPLPGNIV